MEVTKNHLNRRKIKVLFVCLGNICRSPLAEGIFLKLVRDANLEDNIFCDSAGTSGWHTGEQPDERAIANAQLHEIVLNHKARQLSVQDLRDFDYVVSMDAANHEQISMLDDGSEKFDYKLFRMREFEEEVVEILDVPDPYYGEADGFEEVYQILVRTLGRFLDYLIEEHNFK
jgi:protein-tyrosine phosphatase